MKVGCSTRQTSSFHSYTLGRCDGLVPDTPYSPGTGACGFKEAFAYGMAAGRVIGCRRTANKDLHSTTKIEAISAE